MKDFSPIHPEMLDKFDTADKHVTVIRRHHYRCRHCGWQPEDHGSVPALEKHLREKHGFDGKRLWICANTHTDFVREIERLETENAGLRKQLLWMLLWHDAVRREVPLIPSPYHIDETRELAGKVDDEKDS